MGAHYTRHDLAIGIGIGLLSGGGGGFGMGILCAQGYYGEASIVAVVGLIVYGGTLWKLLRKSVHPLHRETRR